MNRIVVLPGWGHDASHWQEFIRISEFDTKVIELPGFGKQELIDPNWGIPEYADWAVAQIEMLRTDTERLVLLGHSFGGRISGLIASRQPEWLSTLILYGSPNLYRPSSSTQTKIRIAKFLKRMGVSGDHGNQELKDAEAKQLDRIFRKAVLTDQTKELQRISAKTLLLWGEQDEHVPLRIAEEMLTLIPDSRLELIPNAGHNAHLENINLFYGKVKSFIQNS